MNETRRHCQAPPQPLPQHTLTSGRAARFPVRRSSLPSTPQSRRVLSDSVSLSSASEQREPGPTTGAPGRPLPTCRKGSSPSFRQLLIPQALCSSLLVAVLHDNLRLSREAKGMASLGKHQCSEELGCTGRTQVCPLEQGWMIKHKTCLALPSPSNFHPDDVTENAYQALF